MSAFRLFGLFLRRGLLCRRLCGSLAAFRLFRRRLLRGGFRLGCGFRRLGLVVLLRLGLCGRLLRRLRMILVVVMTAAGAMPVAFFFLDRCFQLGSGSVPVGVFRSEELS